MSQCYLLALGCLLLLGPPSLSLTSSLLLPLHVPGSSTNSPPHSKTHSHSMSPGDDSERNQPVTCHFHHKVLILVPNTRPIATCSCILSSCHKGAPPQVSKRSHCIKSMEKSSQLAWFLTSVNIFWWVYDLSHWFQILVNTTWCSFL